MKVLNFGSLNIDRVYNVENFVRPGETIKSLEFKETCGGKGLNQSIALKRAGVNNLYHAGKIAFDGQMLLNKLEEDEIDTQFVMRSKGYTGHAVIQVEASGQNNIILFPGANDEISHGEACSVLTHFGKGDKILLQNEISSMDYIIDTAYEREIEIFLNLSPITDSILRCDLNKVSMFLINEIETAALSGEKDIDLSIEILKKKYPNAQFLITLGKEGVKYYDGKQVHHCTSYNVKAVDTTAAGDTFTGYFLAGIFEGKNTPQEILENASMAAAMAVMKLGAVDSIPYKSKVKEMQIQPRLQLKNPKSDV